MEKLKNAYSTSKKFVSDHKVGITVAVTSISWFMINRAALADHDNFLKEKGLYEEFYNSNA